MKLQWYKGRSTPCKYCGDTITFSFANTPVNENGTRHTCENYMKMRSYKVLSRDDVSDSELAQYENTINCTA